MPTPEGAIANRSGHLEGMDFLPIRGEIFRCMNRRKGKRSIILIQKLVSERGLYSTSVLFDLKMNRLQFKCKLFFRTTKLIQTIRSSQDAWPRIRRRLFHVACWRNNARDYDVKPTGRARPHSGGSLQTETDTNRWSSEAPGSSERFGCFRIPNCSRRRDVLGCRPAGQRRTVLYLQTDERAGRGVKTDERGAQLPVKNSKSRLRV